MIDLDGKVRGLYRYPIKGFSAEPLNDVFLTEGAFFPFDRIYAFEVGRSGYEAEDPQFLSKMKYAVLARFPAMAQMKTRYDEVDEVFWVDDVAYDLTAPAGRHSLCRHIETLLAQSEDYDPVAAPLELLSIREARHLDFRFTDSPKGFVSLINLESVRALASLMGTELDPIRFRGNVYVDGFADFEDHDWVGRQIRFGEDGAELEVLKPIVRCVAIHVNPDSAAPDADVCQALWDHYGHKNLGLYARVIRSGRITSPLRHFAEAQ